MKRRDLLKGIIPATIASSVMASPVLGNNDSSDDPPLISGGFKFEDGSKRWYKDGKLHRDDGPAKIYVSGSKEWYKNGKLHRDNGPAYISFSGKKEWYKNGKLHRDDGPSIIFANGTKAWYKKGKL